MLVHKNQIQSTVTWIMFISVWKQLCFTAYYEKLCWRVWAADAAPVVVCARLNQPNFEILFNQWFPDSTTQCQPMSCKRASAYLFNKHQLGAQMGLNLIIHCFDFIWNKTKHNDEAFWQVLVCLGHKLHHPVCCDAAGALLQSKMQQIYRC